MTICKQSVRMIAIDLDGTLLRSDSTVSRHTIDVIQRARDKGVIVAIATGRMYATASPYGKLLGLGDIPMLLYAGGLIQTVEYEKNPFSAGDFAGRCGRTANACKRKKLADAVLY